MKKNLIAIIFILLALQTQAVRTIHVFVALCDNEHQGIVPVPKKIGDGKDPANNLYWGCGYGVKSFFKNNPEWKLVVTYKNPKQNILERLLFKSKTSDVYLLADAYDGEQIKSCVEEFAEATAGNHIEIIKADSMALNFGGGSNLIAYVGHDGLMDFQLDHFPKQANTNHRDAIILACISKNYFRDMIKTTGANPLLWTSGLMAPEAYTLEAAISGWIKNETSDQIRQRAAEAYNKYQHCGMKGAKNLLQTGW